LAVDVGSKRDHVDSESFDAAKQPMKNIMSDQSNDIVRESPRATVYVVGHDPNVLDSIARLLEPSGLRVEIFFRGADFLARYREEGPGCLIADMWLPDMSGRKLQSILAEKGCDIPLVFVAERADARIVVEALKAGAANFFEKPYRDHELYDEIQLAISASAENWRRREEEQNIEERLSWLKHGQRKVVELVASGYTNKEISQMLCLSVRGVENRRARAMQILRVKSKGDLLNLLKYAGLGDSRTGGAAPDSPPARDEWIGLGAIDDRERFFAGEELPVEKRVYRDPLDPAARTESEGEITVTACSST
jgi:two-component system, LuxR family, response regulator FixJ